MKRYFLLLFFLCSFFSASAQSADDEYRSLVKELQELSNRDKTLETVLHQLFESIKKDVGPEVPEEWWQKTEVKFMEKFRADKILNDVANIYAKYLSKDELKDVVAFYKSPSGRKIADNMPAINFDLFNWAQALGKEAANELVGELKASGYKVDM